MDLVVTDAQGCRLADRVVPVALGRGGIGDKIAEGDGITPVGRWLCRGLFYRPDRIERPETQLPAIALRPDDGWCDDPDDRAYNRRVIRPYPARHEALWRDDRVYDLIVPLGFNDRATIPHLGSAIFLHLAHDDYRPTAGCIALGLGDMLAFLADADCTSRIVVMPPDRPRP